MTGVLSPISRDNGAYGRCFGAPAFVSRSPIPPAPSPSAGGGTTRTRILTDYALWEVRSRLGVATDAVEAAPENTPRMRLGHAE